MQINDIKIEGMGKGSKLKLLVASWNVGNAQPPKLLDELIPVGGEGYDIIVIGTQECTYKEEEKGKKRRTSTPDATMDADDEEYLRRSTMRRNSTEKVAKSHFVSLIQTQAGVDFTTVASVNLWQMRLIVLVHKNHSGNVSLVESTKEATGVGHVMGNKGGVMAKMEIYGTSLAFVSCHLAAHEAEKFQQRRNKDCAEIMNGCRTGNAAIDLASQYHHAFWFGDMNYRIDLSHTDKSERLERSHEEHWKEVVGMVERKEYEALLQADGLTRAMDANDVLVGWTAAVPNFNPTFKVERDKILEYKDQRIPSYCDRILWKSMPSCAPLLECTAFNSAEGITTSDHKPVHATFEVQCTPTPSPSGGGMAKLVFGALAAKDTRSMDLNGKSDPYVMFYASPSNLLLEDSRDKHADANHIPRTVVKKETLNPVWDPSPSSRDIPKLRVRAGSKKELKYAHLTLAVVDKDVMSADDLMGQVVLPLDRFWSDTPVEFEEQLTLNGQPAGTVTGILHIQMDGHDHCDCDGHDQAAGSKKETDMQGGEMAVPAPKGCCVVQ